MVPTTIAVAWVSPIDRVSGVDNGRNAITRDGVGRRGRRSPAGTEVTGGDGGR